MSVPAFIDITEEDQVQIFSKIYDPSAGRGATEQMVLQSIVTCLLAKMLRDADRFGLLAEYLLCQICGNLLRQMMLCEGFQVFG